MEQLRRGSELGLVVVLALLLAVWGAFLVPLRVAGVPVPVSAVLALVGNAVLVRAGGRLGGRVGAVVPATAWFVVALALQTRRPEGDIVVPATLAGYGYLLLGALGAAIAVGLTAPREART